ncbi:MAG: winged helix-turn-helix domain-containing protein [Anaerolineales bacterium]|nr:winged helix-turn-helix domain-containing protein [Anaerolineales bacterium]
MSTEMFNPGRFWTRFPPTYRSQEMKILAEWIMAGESGTVVSLSGAGRATLLGYLCRRPDVLQTYLRPTDRQVVLVPVDLINLPHYDLATLYRAILRSFYEIQQRFERTTQTRIRDWYRRTEAAQDPFLPQSALRELLIYFQGQETSIGLVINRFDRFCESATLQMINTLRGLRDSFKETLFYIVSLPQEVVYLSHLESIAPLRHILDTNVCWVDALNADDARQMIQYRTRHLARSINAQTMHQLVDYIVAITGGFPAFIRVACDWWLSVGNQASEVDWVDTLLQKQNMRHRLRELWNGLTQEDQVVLSELARHQIRYEPGIEGEAEAQSAVQKKGMQQFEQQYTVLLPRLAARGVCRYSRFGWRINGHLLTAYAAANVGQSRGKIWVDAVTGAVFQGSKLLANLPPIGRSVLQFLTEHPHTRHTHTALIEAAWPDDVLKAGVTTEALYQAIRNIRKEIEPDPASPLYIINWRGQPEGGYQFFPEGRPVTHQYQP